MSLNAEQRLSYVRDVVAKMADVCAENAYAYQIKNWPEFEKRSLALRDAYLWIGDLIDSSADPKEVA